VQAGVLARRSGRGPALRIFRRLGRLFLPYGFSLRLELLGHRQAESTNSSLCSLISRMIVVESLAAFTDTPLRFRAKVFFHWQKLAP
jgi:hypothetical protein